MILLSHKAQRFSLGRIIPRQTAILKIDGGQLLSDTPVVKRK